MAISDYDYEKVDPSLWFLVVQTNSFENAIMTNSVPGSSEIIKAIAEFRQQINLEIERQGARS